MIIKQFKTETAHIVRNAFSQRCANSIHGHTYFYEVAIDGAIRDDGMILDFKKLQSIKEFIDQFDHSTVLWGQEKESIKSFFIDNFDRVLIMKKNPTAENMTRLVSKFVYEWLQGNFPNCNIVHVRIWETTTGSAMSRDFDLDDVFTYVSEGIKNGE